MRKNIAAGNWKMNLEAGQAETCLKELEAFLTTHEGTAETIIAPPAIYLGKLQSLAQRVTLAAQNCHQASAGAFTGEWSAPQLKSMGIGHVILGHSERRSIFHESDEQIGAKTDAALATGLTVILCCGETLEERKGGKHISTVVAQLGVALKNVDAAQMEKVIIAYEPVWAIGTGETASAEQAQEMHKEIRAMLAERYENETAEATRILYGGSVKPGNAAELFAMPDVDGGLVGGASLKSSDFSQIIAAAG